LNEKNRKENDLKEKILDEIAPRIRAQIMVNLTNQKVKSHKGEEKEESAKSKAQKTKNTEEKEEGRKGGRKE